MICLDSSDTLEGGASVDAVVDYTVHGLVGSTFTQLASGQLSNTDPSVLYTAATAVSIVSITLVNTHSAAVTVNLYLDPANVGTPRRMIPKNVSLGIGYALVYDGQRFSVMNADGNILSSVANVTGLPGLLADDQHILDSEVLAYLLALTGAAVNKKLFIDAAGTAVEWATGIKIGNFTYDTATASGTQAITGVGFKPSHIIFAAIGVAANEMSVLGLDNGTNHYAFHYNQAAWSIHASYSILLYQTTVIYAIGEVTTLGTDGFTITWTKEGAKTGVASIIYMAFR